jgi:hypothetical protein
MNKAWQKRMSNSLATELLLQLPNESGVDFLEGLT